MFLPDSPELRFKPSLLHTTPARSPGHHDGGGVPYILLSEQATWKLISGWQDAEVRYILMKLDLHSIWLPVLFLLFITS